MTHQNILFYVLPALFFVLFAYFDDVLPFDYQVLYLYHEVTGFIENAQFGVLLIAALTALCLVFKTKQDKPLFAWFLTAFVCCFFVAGEEISWGQHYFGWATSESWALINDQNETNFHNTSSWFDQKPRLLLELCVIFGGLIWPFLKRSKGFVKNLPAFVLRVMPDTRLWFIALLGESAMFSERFVEVIIGKEAKSRLLFERPSEVHELYLYYFVLCYLLVFSAQIKAAKAKPVSVKTDAAKTVKKTATKKTTPKKTVKKKKGKGKK